MGTHMVAQLNALQITINAQHEQNQITAKNKLLAPHALRTIMANVAHHLLTAQHSANLMKKNAQPQEKMIMAVPFHQHVSFKKETTMENFTVHCPGVCNENQIMCPGGRDDSGC